MDLEFGVFESGHEGAFEEVMAEVFIFGPGPPDGGAFISPLAGDGFDAVFGAGHEVC